MSGLGPEGFKPARLPDLKAQLEAELRARLDQGLNLELDSVLSRLVGITASHLADVWELAEVAWIARHPDSAEGGALDDVASLVGLHRTDRSAADLLMTGAPGTVVPAGARVAVAGSSPPVEFALDAATTLAPLLVAACRVKVLLDHPGSRYTVTVNGQSYVYTTALLPQAPGSVANALAAQLMSSGVLVFGPSTQPGGNPPVGSQEIFLLAPEPSSSFQVTTGYAQPQIVDVTFKVMASYVYKLNINGQTFTAASGSPAHMPSVLGTFVTAINGAGLPVVCWSDFSTPTPTLRLIGTVPGAATFTVTVAPPLGMNPQSYTLLSSAAETGTRGLAVATAEAVEAGPVAAPSDSLTVITTPTPGWDRVRNPQSASLGGPPEGDAAFRRRRRDSLRTANASVLEGIRRALLAVPGVTQVFVLENPSFSNVAGRPPLSIECVVDGGTDQDITRTLWLVKPAGVNTTSTLGTAVSLPVSDSMGFFHTLTFSRPQRVAVWFDVVVTPHPEEERAPNWQDAIRQEILSYGQTLGMGQDLVRGRFVAKVAALPGVYKVTLRMAPGTAAGPSGPWVTGNLAMGFAQMPQFAWAWIAVS